MDADYFRKYFVDDELVGALSLCDEVLDSCLKSPTRLQPERYTILWQNDIVDDKSTVNLLFFGSLYLPNYLIRTICKCWSLADRNCSCAWPPAIYLFGSPLPRFLSDEVERVRREHRSFSDANVLANCFKFTVRTFWPVANTLHHFYSNLVRVFGAFFLI